MLTVRPWDTRDGDPASPDCVFGVPVDHLIVERADAPGALVELRDRRVALSGPIAAIGRHRALRSYVRDRARGAGDSADRHWLEQVSTTLEGLHPEARSAGAVW
jgi:hypothetical protein